MKTNQYIIDNPDNKMDVKARGKALVEDMNNLERLYGYKKTPGKDQYEAKNAQNLVKLAKNSHAVSISMEFDKIIK